MGKLVVTTNVTLDGVMQAPGAPEEDVRDRFEHGGWAAPYNDAVMAQKMGEGMAQTGAMLFGRRTYERFYDVWAHRTDGNPFTQMMNNVQKYVASSTLTEPLPWVNSTLLDGDAADAVVELKQQPGLDLAVIGSGELVQSLARRGLVDEYTLLIHPLVLPSARPRSRAGSVSARTAPAGFSSPSSCTSGCPTWTTRWPSSWPETRTRCAPSRTRSGATSTSRSWWTRLPRSSRQVTT